MSNEKVPYEWTKWLAEESGNNSIYLLCMRNALPDIMDTELTDIQKQYVEMRFYRHMTLQEIADEMGIDRSTVSKTLKRALMNMKKALDYVYLGAKISADADEY